MGKKIGIMTFWTSKDNYGQILQAYALQTVLRKMGHEPFLIRYDHRHDPTFASTIKEKVFHLLKDPSILIRFFRSKVAKKGDADVDIHDRKFDEFIRDHMTVSEKLYTDYRELKANPPEADVYICGSDVVWTPIASMEPFFLTFCTNAKRIAYAPSFGTGVLPGQFIEKIRPWLSVFNAISTREDSGAVICNRVLGRKDCICNPDPTLLLDSEDYMEVYRPTSLDSEDKSCVAYFLGSDTNVEFAAIGEFARKKGLKLKFIPAQNCKEEGNHYPTIEEWLSDFACAKYIFTNSFHGCVFAILFNKKFMFFPLKGSFVSMNERIVSLFEIYKIRFDRMFNGNIDCIDQDIDYTEVNVRLKNKSILAKEWLREVI